jgi:ribonucleotide monophosphatase NagD (HAD superfamily)
VWGEARLSTRDALQGLELNITQDVFQAEFILAHGTEVLGAGEGQVERACDEKLVKEILKQAAARRLPMIVANPVSSVASRHLASSHLWGAASWFAGLGVTAGLFQPVLNTCRVTKPTVSAQDLVTVSGKELVTMHGTFAKWYAEMGGEVDYMGKPAQVVYDTALEMAGEMMAGGVVGKAEVVAVGDSLEHDIQGAAEAGISSVFVTSGIHLNDLPFQCLEQNTDMSLRLFDKEVARLATSLGTAVPPFYVSTFRW